MLNRRLLKIACNICLSLSLFSLLALAACGTEPTGSREEQAQAIDKLLMCPVCPAETIDQAQVPLARDMKAFVREKLAEGWTKQQILDYFSAPERYGPSVLAEPPKSGVNLIVWVIPPIALLFGAAIVVYAVRLMSRTEMKHPPDTSDETLGPYLAQVDLALESECRSKEERGIAQPRSDLNTLDSEENGT